MGSCNQSLFGTVNEDAGVPILHVGEEMTDEGEAYICGHPVSSQLRAAQQLTGYCPQFDGLPGQMTGTCPALQPDEAAAQLSSARVEGPVMGIDHLLTWRAAGREVLRMYARLRGVPRDLREGLAERLLQRLSLAQYADRWPLAYVTSHCSHLGPRPPLLPQPCQEQKGWTLAVSEGGLTKRRVFKAIMLQTFNCRVGNRGTPHPPRPWATALDRRSESQLQM
jgi:hypothetical protein